MSKYEIKELLPGGDYMDEDGDVLPFTDEPQVISVSEAFQSLSEDHPVYPSRDTDPNPGPSTPIAPRRQLFLSALDDLALMHKAEGMLSNTAMIDREARTKGLTREQVISNKEYQRREKRLSAWKAFEELAGYAVLQSAGVDTTGLSTITDFDRKYFGSEQAKKDNRKIRRTFKKQ